MGKKHGYGVVIDAGSSGSRAYIYEYKKASYVKAKNDKKELARLPHIKTDKDWNLKVKPGISTFGEKPERVGEDHLKALVEFAVDNVPSAEIQNTPIFLLATAGMRLLPPEQRDAVLQHTCSYLRQKTAFQLPDCGLHIQVIPGETEGLYGWIAANYLVGGFDKPEEHDHGKGHHTYGFLDMGGASAQIAFAPNATEAKKHANDLKLLRLRKVNGESMEYGVFVTTWLGFGANEARRRYVDQLFTTHSEVNELPDPCLPNGITVNRSGKEIEAGGDGKDKQHLSGTGNFKECLKTVYPLLEKEKACGDPPCLVNGVHTPAIDFDVNHFVGVSEYWHTTHEVFAMAHKDKAYDFHTYQKQVTELCSRDWTAIKKDVANQKWGRKVDAKTVEEVCFKASWLINMLHDGIGIPRVALTDPQGSGSGNSNTTNAVLDSAKNRGFLDPFQAVNKIDGTEVSWTLGKMVLYASSQMPPANDVMDVGFGSNLPGKHLPEDFQRPTSENYHNSTDPKNTQTLDDDTASWHDKILTSSYSRRVPGILIFLLILALAAYLLYGRERRLSLYHKFFGGKSRGTGKRRKAPGGNSKLTSFFRGGDSSQASYERVMEDGPDFDDDDDAAREFELPDLPTDAAAAARSSDSDGSDHVRTGRTSGIATPATRGLSPDIARQSPKMAAGYFDAGGAAGLSSSSASAPASSALGLGITPFERGGLIERTESKERLAPRRAGSRAGSPRRSVLLMQGLKESVE